MIKGKKTWAVTVFLWSLALPWLTASPCPAADPVRIAAVFAKTGDARPNNIYHLQGVRLAVDQLNKNGGILGGRVELIEIDNKSTPLGSKLAALEAIKHNVTAVIGAAWSSHSLGMAPVLQEAGIPMISPVSTNPKVTQAGNYIFRVCITDPFQGQVMAQFAYQDLNARTAAVLTNISSDYSMGLSEYFINAFTQHRGKILLAEKYLESSTDFQTHLEKIKELKPDAVFVPGYPRACSLLLKQAVNMGVKTVFLGGDGWGEPMLKMAGEAVEGHYHSALWHPRMSFPMTVKFQEYFKAAYGEEARVGGIVFSYDAVMLLADAIARANTIDRGKIRDTLAATKDFKGVTGSITFDENRNPVNRTAVVMTFKNNNPAFVKTITP